jgi:hypothetical protein
MALSIERDVGYAEMAARLRVDRTAGLCDGGSDSLGVCTVSKTQRAGMPGRLLAQTLSGR